MYIVVVVDDFEHFDQVFNHFTRHIQSRNQLSHQIGSRLIHIQGGKILHFATLLLLSLANSEYVVDGVDYLSDFLRVLVLLVYLVLEVLL